MKLHRLNRTDGGWMEIKEFPGENRNPFDYYEVSTFDRYGNSLRYNDFFFHKANSGKKEEVFRKIGELMHRPMSSRAVPPDSCDQDSDLTDSDRDDIVVAFLSAT